MHSNVKSHKTGTQLHLCGMIGSTTSKTFFVMLRRLDASKLSLFWTVCGRNRGMMELGAGNRSEPEINASKEFWRQYVQSCGRFYGFPASILYVVCMLTLERDSSEYSPSSFKSRGEPPAQVSCPKSPNAPPRNKEREGGSIKIQ